MRAGSTVARCVELVNPCTFWKGLCGVDSAALAATLLRNRQLAFESATAQGGNRSSRRPETLLALEIQGLDIGVGVIVKSQPDASGPGLTPLDPHKQPYR